MGCCMACNEKNKGINFDFFQPFVTGKRVRPDYLPAMESSQCSNTRMSVGKFQTLNANASKTNMNFPIFISMDLCFYRVSGKQYLAKISYILASTHIM